LPSILSLSLSFLHPFKAIPAHPKLIHSHCPTYLALHKKNIHKGWPLFLEEDKNRAQQGKTEYKVKHGE